MSDSRAENWGTWLRERLDELGWNQADLVREGNLSRNNVSRWFRGLDVPNHRNVIVIANALGASHDEAMSAAGFVPVDIPAPTFQLQDYTSEQLLEELLARARRNTEQPMRLVSIARDASTPAALPEYSPEELERIHREEPAAAYEPDYDWQQEEEESQRDP